MRNWRGVKVNIGAVLRGVEWYEILDVREEELGQRLCKGCMSVGFVNIFS
jgi:hypothetical protein